MTKSSIFYYLAALLSLIICPNALVFGNPYTVGPDDKNSDQVLALISQLDSTDFRQREQAGEELINIGERAIGPLALKSFECSPEACWRIRKILEQISSRGNETVFYKTTGILQLRFDTSNAEMEKRLSELETKWKTQRKKQAIATLRKSGAVVDDPLEDSKAINPPEFGGEIFLGGGRHVLIVDGKVIERSSPRDNLAQREPKRAPKKRLSAAQAKQEVKRILGSDLDQAREIVIGEKTTDAAPAQSIDPNRLNDQQQMLVLRGGLNISTHRPGQGVTIELGDRWKGTANDLNALNEVSNLTEVKLSSQSLDDSVLEKIATVKSINKLVFKECDISAKAIKSIKWPNSVKEIELANLSLSNDLLASLRSFPAAHSLAFRDCELKPGVNFDVLNQLTTLRGLHFEGLDISGELFKSFGKMEQLTYISMSICKFQTTDYKALEKIRPNLQISYTAKAFLGVRGPIDMGQVRPGIGGCVVSEVIAGSGAQKGGIKVHDVIETVNGQKVEVFDDLRLHIAQHRPGEKLDVTVNRLGKSVDLEIELSSFDKELR